MLGGLRKHLLFTFVGGGSTLTTPSRQGVAKNTHLVKTSSEWQMPLSLELVAAGFMLLGCLSLPESTRRLISKNRNDEARKSLAWMRGDESDGAKLEEPFPDADKHPRGAQTGAAGAREQGFILCGLLR